MEQEQIARAIVEQENQKYEKADEIAERYIELKKKDERVQSTLKAVKSEAERVKRDLATATKHAQEAKEATKQWQEKEAERLGRDKDSLLEKYLRSRSENESQLRDLQHTMLSKHDRQPFRKLGQMARVGADSFDDDRYQESVYDLPYDAPHLDASDAYRGIERPDHLRRRRPDSDDDHLDLYDDDLPLDGSSLYDGIRHLKRLQGQEECREEPHPYPRMDHDGSGRGFGHSADLLPSGRSTDTKMHRRRPIKKEKREKEGDLGDSDFDLNLDDDGEYDFGRVRGLSNQIEHVKKLRRLPPFKGVRS